MAAEVLVVLLESRPVAEIGRTSGGAARIRFLDDYLADIDATPLSLSLPPSTGGHGERLLNPFLWGLLPDNADVLDRWGRQFGVSVASPLPLLATQIGHDCAGAVQFCEPDEVDDLIHRPGGIEPLSGAELAQRLRSLRRDSTTWLGPGFTGQFSLGGAQAKTALHLTGGTWAVPTGSTPTTHIIKPSVAGFDDRHLNEHLCLSAAGILGLRACTSSILTVEDQTAIAVERFDRAHRDGTTIRVHQEDLCQALAVPPYRKYQSEGGPTPGDIAGLLRAAVPGPHTDGDIWRFADAMAFNWLIAGTDAHAKNYGLLLSGQQVRLAPLYDVSSYLPYDDSRGRRVKLAMKLGGDYKLLRSTRRVAWERAADELGLPPEALTERVAGLASRAPDAFGEAASRSDVVELGSELPGRLVEMVTRRCRECREALS